MCRNCAAHWRTVKAWHHMAAVVVTSSGRGNHGKVTCGPGYRAGWPVCASHKMPQIVLASRMRPFSAIRFASDKGTRWLRSSRPPPAGFARLKTPSHVDRHRFVKKSGLT